MDHYLDLRLRPDPEFPPAMLMGALFSKLHRALVTLDADDLGVSFPEHASRPRTLGTVLRVHGTESRLEQLMGVDWLTGMRDHVAGGMVARVPDGAQHRLVRRVQPKTSAERLRRRHMKRHQVSADVARERIPDDVESRVVLPFVMIRSRSTGQGFCLFIDHRPVQAEAVVGTFSRYGLSAVATVPWF